LRRRLSRGILAFEGPPPSKQLKGDTGECVALGKNLTATVRPRLSSVAR
jgi:hypothetical protein